MTVRTQSSRLTGWMLGNPPRPLNWAGTGCSAARRRPLVACGRLPGNANPPVLVALTRGARANQLAAQLTLALASRVNYVLNDEYATVGDAAKLTLATVAPACHGLLALGHDLVG